MNLKLNKFQFFLIGFAVLFTNKGFHVFTNAQENCKTPDFESGYCLPDNKCDKYMEYLKTKFENDELKDFLKKSQCNQNNKTTIHICCDELYVTPNSFYGVNEYISSLDPRGFEILSSMEQCGNNTNQRISFGSGAKLGEFPWMALIEYDTPKQRCGGSLITNRYVLTAAHCLTREEKITSVILGEYNLDTDPDCQLKRGVKVCMPPRERVGIEKIVPHPNYSKYNITFDIGLIKLNTTVNFKENIKPICLPITPFSLKLQSNYIIAGWGITETGSPARLLQMALLNYKERSDCENEFRHRITFQHICVGGDGPINNCGGDSGGPLFNADTYLPLQARYIQHGIVSLGGTNCSALMKGPSIHTNVTVFMPWITSNIIDITNQSQTDVKTKKSKNTISNSGNFRINAIRLLYLLVFIIHRI